MLLPRWGEFMLCGDIAEGGAHGRRVLPFQGVGGCEAWREGMCVAWVVRALRMII